MKKFVKIALAAALVLALCMPAWSARSYTSRAQYRKNMAYNKNFLPAGWRYEAGYALWRMNRKAPATPTTYRRYRNDRAWHYRTQRSYPEELALSTLDWTAEEVALFMDYFRFHPAGYER